MQCAFRKPDVRTRLSNALKAEPFQRRNNSIPGGVARKLHKAARTGSDTKCNFTRFG